VHDKASSVEKTTVLCFMVTSKGLTKKHLAELQKLGDAQLPMQVQWLAVKQAMSMQGPGCEGAMQVVVEGLPVVLDAVRLAPWLSLAKRLYRWSEMEGQGQGLYKLDKPILASSREWTWETQGYPVYLMMATLKKQGWSINSEFKGPHRKGGPMEFCLRGAATRPSYFRCLLRSQELLEQGALIHVCQHEMYYRCMLCVKSPKMVEPRQTVAFYKQLMKDGGFDVVIAQGETIPGMDGVDLPAVWEMEHAHVADHECGDPAVLLGAAASSSAGPVEEPAAGAMGVVSADDSAVSSCGSGSESGESDGAEVLAGPSFKSLATDVLPKELEGQVVHEEVWHPPSSADSHRAYQKSFGSNVPGLDVRTVELIHVVRQG